MRTIEFDTIYQSEIGEAVLIKTTYDAPYSEPDYTNRAAVSFPLHSWFGYRVAGKEWLTDGNCIILERAETEFSVRKFKPFTGDFTLSIQLPDEPEVLADWLPGHLPAFVFQRQPGIERRLRHFLAAAGALQGEQGLLDLLEAVFAAKPNGYSEEERLNIFQWRQVEQAKEFIHENLSEQLTISQIAKAVNVSPFHFSRLFRRATGRSPYDYLLLSRLEHARLLILAGLPVTQSAFASGFNSLENFSLAFRKIHGFSPVHAKMRKIY